MRNLILIFCLVFSGAFASGTHSIAASDHNWQTYVNARFRYSLCYPEDLLVPQGESDDGDGQAFIAKDGAKLIVYGSNNALSQSIRDDFTETTSRLAGGKGSVTYKVIKPKWFAASGRTGDKIFYVKTIYDKREDQFKSFEVTYDQSTSQTYQPVIDRIASCFSEME